MNIDNVLQVLEKTDCQTVRSVAIKFIAENLQEVMAQPGWKNVEKEHMTEIIKEMTRAESPQNKKPRLMLNH